MQQPATLWTPVRWCGPKAGRVVQAVQVLAFVQVLVFTASTLGTRGSVGFDVWLDGWLKASAYVTCAVLVLLRPALLPLDRTVWWLVAAGISLRAAAFVVYLSVVRLQDPQPYPSVADAGWLLMYVMLGAALLLLARARFAYVSRVLALDAVVAVSAAGALAASVVPDIIRLANDHVTTDLAVVVNTAYPLVDAALLLLTLGILLLYHWRPPPGLWLFAIGALLFAVVDVVFLYLLATGQFRPGSPLSALSLVATAIMALSAWAPPGHRREDQHSVPGLAVPAMLGMACVALLVWGAVAPEQVSAATLLLAVLGVLTAGARIVLTVTSIRLASAADRRATRQALLTRLVEAQDAERVRIAADVHDDSLQALAAVDLRLASLRRRLETAAPDEVAGLDVASETVRLAALRLRHLLFELDTPALEAELPDALTDAGAHLFADAEIAWSVRAQGDAAGLSEHVRVSAYRIAREAMVNVLKHARARNLSVTVEVTASGVQVEVVDDGVGAASRSAGHGDRRPWGVSAMRDRAVACGGWWRSAPGPGGKGTRVAFYLPREAAAGASDVVRRLALGEQATQDLGGPRDRDHDLTRHAPAKQ